MQDKNKIGTVSDYGGKPGSDTNSDRKTGVHAGDASGVQGGDSSDTDGWQQYRKWISTAPAPRTRRGSVDPSLYTWKGYRTWTEQIKRTWSDS
jgi:hypothetical protein